ncbi:MAG: oligosaccharide flippase family protein [Angelakisella sp.]
MISIKNKPVFKNVIMLYLMNIAKMIFPLLTLPYLTRVLSLDCYGTVQYVKSFMVSIQLFVDFGFVLSGVRDIVKCEGDRDKIGSITGTIIASKVILSLVALVFLVVASFAITLLKVNVTFTIVSYVDVMLSCFLADFLFRGLEKMQVITARFVITRAISTALTFVFVKSDADILWIPILDIISSFIAIIITWKKIGELDIHFRCPRLSKCIDCIKSSFAFFASQLATSAFGAFSTIVIGLFMSSNDVALWSISLQLITAAQALYTPISNGIYPHMVTKRNIRLVNNILKLFMPLILLASLATCILAPYIISIISGPKYLQAVTAFRCMIPDLIFSFPVLLYGWPTLGSINKVRQITVTTVVAAIVQISGLFILQFCHQFTLINIAILRSFSEFLLMAMRYGYYRIYKNEFVLEDGTICAK